MGWLAFKYLATAFVVVLASEVAKRSDKVGALVAALPLVTVMALIWIHIETGSTEKVSNHAWYTFWYVIPTLPMFLAFPALLSRLGFWGALCSSVIITMLCFAIFSKIVKLFGIDLDVV